MFLKKLLPKLPVCPYCGTVYRSGDIAKIVFKRKESCYHCKKSFQIGKARLLILLMEMIVCCLLFDLFVIRLVQTVTALFIINIILVVIGLCLIPFYIDFKKA